MDVPRLHFAGQFRADTNTRNNKNCNFDLNNKLSQAKETNYAGSNEFEFINTKITTVVDKYGHEDKSNELIGAEIFSNENKPFAKIIDLDVDFQVSSIYGLSLGLRHNGTIIFVGNWEPSVIVYDMWEKVKCTKFYSDIHKHLSTQSTSKIVDIVWSDSHLISEFKSESQKSCEKLHVSITLDSYNCDAFTIGRVYGTIGKTSSYEPLCVGGERKMMPVDPGLFSFDENHPCSGYPQNDQKPWTYGAPFNFDLKRKVLAVDLSNALPTHFISLDFQQITAPIDLGDLYFGYILNHQRKSIKPIGDSIPYLKSDMWKQSGIFEVSVTDEDDLMNLQNSELVVFTESNIANTLDSNTYHMIFHSDVNITLLLKETKIFTRPMGHYMARLQHSSQLTYSESSFMKDSHEFIILVTRFGKPINNTNVTMIKSYNQFGNASHMQYPYDAVKFDEMTKLTNETGHVKFKFTLEEVIPIKRHYTKDPECTPKSAEKSSKVNNTYYVLPIDGQVYNFYYCVGDKCRLPENSPRMLQPFLFQALISILAFSTVIYDNDYEPTWVGNIKDYFEQQHHLNYAMRSIVDMSNYTAVTLPHNIELLKHVLSKDSEEAFLNDPGYMPATRDLSPIKRKIILKWLEKPCFNESCVAPEFPNQTAVFTRCLLETISFTSDPQDQNCYLKELITKDLKSLDSTTTEIPPRPLFGLEIIDNKEFYQILSKYFEKESYQSLCNINSLQKQLQQAIELEFYTIPLYLTSLYSIVENHNTDGYKAIREVVMQEMLHFVQAANILIAIGGKVMIDGPDFVPKYPAKGLPGHVHPYLNINLRKYNLEHVHSTFLVIELPMSHNLDDVSTLYTIGMLYKEIEQCIKILTDDIFKESNVKKQVKWPWNTNNLGNVHIVNDTESAIRGINEIIEQGEGAAYLNFNQIDTGMYPHYYRFEELVCKRRLVKIDDHSYAFSGDPIIFDKLGVYPMVDGPNKNSFQPNTYCYTQARVFHRVYRNLLKVLQKTFNGEPEKITEAVELMESLQMHAKRCISTPYMVTGYNCGPVWDYEWE